MPTYWHVATQIWSAWIKQDKFMLTGDAHGEADSEDQTPPRSKSTSELATDDLDELLES